MANYSEEMKQMLRGLRDKILLEYDNSDEIGVRVNLLPKAHNSMSDAEKILKPWLPLSDEEIEEAKRREIYEPVGDEYDQFLMNLGYNPENYKDKIVVEINPHNAHHDPANVVIHETTPGVTITMPEGINTKDVKRPTKPKFWTVDELYGEGITEDERKKRLAQNRSTVYYDKLIRNLGYNKGHGRTIGYHARIDYPNEQCKGMFGKPEIVILMPATASPDQVSNKKVAPYVYGIERCVGEDQNFHLAIANQAMLTAFVLKEMGYDTNKAMKHIFPHNFFAINKGACPARMLYASYLVEQSKTRELSNEEYDDIREYVPWEVFMGLVKSFRERDRYPETLQRKFIYDMSDYDAYMENPESYDYRLRRALKQNKAKNTVSLNGIEDEYSDPTTIHFDKIDINSVKISKPDSDIDR